MDRTLTSGLLEKTPASPLVLESRSRGRASEETDGIVPIGYAHFPALCREATTLLGQQFSRSRRARC
jgi:hypothetical protein